VRFVRRFTVDAIDRSAVLSRDVGLSDFVKTESENRCANLIKLIDEKSLKWIRTFVVRGQKE
jgi:hypothetical protein